MAAYFGRPAGVPELAGREKHGELAAGISQPTHEEDATGEYGSLLSLPSPFAAKGEGFARIDEPVETDVVEPAVLVRQAGARPFDPPAAATLPGSAPATPAAARPDGDEALRQALATLQRMRGGR